MADEARAEALRRAVSTACPERVRVQTRSGAPEGEGRWYPSGWGWHGWSGSVGCELAKPNVVWSGPKAGLSGWEREFERNPGGNEREHRWSVWQVWVKKSAQLEWSVPAVSRGEHQRGWWKVCGKCECFQCLQQGGRRVGG